MPTRDADPSFFADWKRLRREQKRQFRAALVEFIHDVDSGQFRPSLRVHPMQGYPGVWEMTWEGNNGRATFSYGPEQLPGKMKALPRQRVVSSACRFDLTQCR
jgi:hypothetical protein